MLASQPILDIALDVCGQDQGDYLQMEKRKMLFYPHERPDKRYGWQTQ